MKKQTKQTKVKKVNEIKIFFEVQKWKELFKINLQFNYQLMYLLCLKMNIKLISKNNG